MPAAETVNRGADALAVLRRLCPLTEVLSALGCSDADLDAWRAAAPAWPLYVHPGDGTVLVDPAVVLAGMAKRCAA
jgi:hypothetical protein